jgi:hypothetical protein
MFAIKQTKLIQYLGIFLMHEIHFKKKKSILKK